MGGMFILGEQKTRPGAYFNVQKKGTNAAASIVNGVTAVIFKSDFGPLCKAIELSKDDGYEDVFGNALTTDAMKEAFNGGAKTVIACRVGDGGTDASLELDDSEDAVAVTLAAKYPGAKAFTATVRTSLSDVTKKECIIYAGTSEFEKVEFASGTGEGTAIVAAFANSKNFTATLAEGKGNAIIKPVSQSAFTAGTNPTVSNADYSNAFAAIEAFDFNTVCLDTEETAVHLLLSAFINRIYETGSLTMGVVAEPHTVPIETRISHAAAFNDNKMHYVLNAYVNEQGTEIDGYKTAARIAGMIGASASNSSLTHTVINGFTETLEMLTNTQVINAENHGCIVLTYNAEKQVWIDSAINTLITPADNQDDGWKKIRRTKTRFELIRRVNVTTDNLVGKVDNDMNGRSTVISQIQQVGDAMVSESKLLSCKVTESSVYPADGDSAWFDIEVVDKDSMEHIYMSFVFQFSTIVE